MEDVDLKEVDKVKEKMRQIIWDYESGKLGERKLTAIIYAYKKYSDLIIKLIKVRNHNNKIKE